MRSFAELATDEASRKSFLKLAAEYDKLAERAAVRIKKPKP